VFATTEQGDVLVASRRDEVADKLTLVRSWLEQKGVAGVVLAGVDGVAWLTAGLTTPIERGAPVGPLRLLVTHDLFAAVTTNVERARIEVESGLDELGIPLYDAPWFEPGGLERVAAELIGRPCSELASDRAPGFALVCDDDFVGLRLTLVAPERERLERLAVATVAALEGALGAWRPGERDLDVHARIDEALGRVGAFAACLIVGGDERVRRFRHPLACGAEMHRLVMAVVVAERAGLHAAATRFACVDGLPDDVRASRRAARAVEAEMLEASAAHPTYGELMRTCERAYAAAGYPGAWREHYQGGPIGYRQREFELTPTQTESRWYGTAVAQGHVLAWNPSVAGGGKSEDTYAVEPEGLRRLTDSGRWPLEGGRPAVLDIATGLAA
jgi:Xaa-Pro aminopeptidase